MEIQQMDVSLTCVSDSHFLKRHCCVHAWPDTSPWFMGVVFGGNMVLGYMYEPTAKLPGFVWPVLGRA